MLRDDFISAEVVHRNAEIQHISRVLSPLTDGQTAETFKYDDNPRRLMPGEWHPQDRIIVLSALVNHVCIK